MIPHETNAERPPTKLYTFQIVIETDADGDGYTAYSPTLPGCFRRAGTVEKAKERIREAVRERVEWLLAHGEPISQCEKLMHVEELSIAVPAQPAGDGT
jgi:predicted RNase H-like HicB family nuclease